MWVTRSARSDCLYLVESSPVARLVCDGDREEGQNPDLNADRQARYLTDKKCNNWYTH